MQVSASDDGDTVTNSVEYSKKLFAYPAYIAIYASNLSYEYALLDEENNRIIYFSLCALIIAKIVAELFFEGFWYVMMALIGLWISNIVSKNNITLDSERREGMKRQQKTD